MNKNYTTRFLPFFIALILLVSCQRDDSLSIEDPWARPGSAGSNSAAYFQIDNPTNQEDYLIGASSPAASQVELHMSVMGEDETMSMHPQKSVTILGGSQVRFEPGGMHLMLVDLQKVLVEGEAIELILRFQKAGEVTLQVPVEQR